ncbi:hypothetical protein [Pseudobacillus badius]|uniref:hypothetical protein n=1 Tax=Bacillus badius TaxID=1455 RepID=UPI0024A2DC9F|nr:hypothetical protein [Bacillus badius]GLY09582.1 hypothetical protein Bbad01_07980 [Bacillus badius]
MNVKSQHKTLKLSDGSFLHRTEEGVFATSLTESSIPICIDQEEGELLLIELVEQQQQAIEGLKRQFNWSVSGSTVSLEKSAESAREWFANQTELVEEVHELKQRIERYGKALSEITHLTAANHTDLYWRGSDAIRIAREALGSLDE